MVRESSKLAAGKRVPVEDGLFTLPDDPGEEPRLIASRCETCGEVFFPERIVCLKCTGREMERILLSTRGKVFSFAVTRQAPPGSVIPTPYVLASIEMPEGVNIHTVLTDCDVDKVHIGDEMEMVIRTIKKDEAGRDVVGFMFRPV